MREYIKYLEHSGRQRAADLYFGVLQRFSMWLKLRGKDISTFTPSDAEDFVFSNTNPNTCNFALSALKGYTKWHLSTLDPRAKDYSDRVSTYNRIQVIKPKQKSTRIQKVSLTPDEVSQLLEMIEHGGNDILYSGTVIHFYFGARPSELTTHLRTARINWDNNSMVIKTSKRDSERYLAWNNKLTPHLNRWMSHIPVYPEWLTKRLSVYTVGGIHISSKTARKTVQTQFRLRGIDDFITDTILGHVSKSPIADVYTDFSLFENTIRDVMINKHYMITEGII